MLDAFVGMQFFIAFIMVIIALLFVNKTKEKYRYTLKMITIFGVSASISMWCLYWVASLFISILVGNL